MNVIVCLKQVPGTTKVQIDPQTNTLIRQGIENITNPFDTYALEEGVRLKEHYGGKVTAISMGPPQAENMLREAISAGADEAVLLSAPEFAGADTLATSYTIAGAADRLAPYDIIIRLIRLGYQSNQSLLSTTSLPGRDTAGRNGRPGRVPDW
jgi:electron transfer flavoprotein beta subunit